MKKTEAKTSPHIKQATRVSTCPESKLEENKKIKDKDVTYNASYKKSMEQGYISESKLHFFFQFLWKPKESDSVLYEVCFTKNYFHKYDMKQVSTKSKHLMF